MKILIVLLLLPAGLAFGQEYRPEDTEVWEPRPEIVTPGEGSGAPSDAIVLFDGTSTDEWQKPVFSGEDMTSRALASRTGSPDQEKTGEPIEWTIEGNDLVVKPGSGPIETKRKFKDVQLHIEWLAPVDEGKTSQGYSNSGVFLMSLYEIQVLNSYENETYSNGQAGSIYKQYMPMVNASRPPGTWQYYDIVFLGPEFDEIGNLVAPARMTAFHNGVLIHHDVELKGPTVYIGPAHYTPHPEKLPIQLQDHGNPVRFRNIWVRELD